MISQTLDGVRAVREFLANAGEPPRWGRRPLKYKDYVGATEVDEEAGVIFGRVLGLRDVITFQGETVGEARRSFEESVDFYLKMCADRGEAPERPFSG